MAVKTPAEDNKIQQQQLQLQPQQQQKRRVNGSIYANQRRF